MQPKKLSIMPAHTRKVKKFYLLEEEMKYSTEERNAFITSLQQFAAFKKDIFRESMDINNQNKPVPFSTKIKTICDQIGQIVEASEGFTLSGTDGWFDDVSVNRDLKSLKDDYKLFQKTCQEMAQLQQRLESAYEAMGIKLSKYYKL